MYTDNAFVLLLGFHMAHDLTSDGVMEYDISLNSPDACADFYDTLKLLAGNIGTDEFDTETRNANNYLLDGLDPNEPASFIRSLNSRLGARKICEKARRVLDGIGAPADLEFERTRLEKSEALWYAFKDYVKAMGYLPLFPRLVQILAPQSKDFDWDPPTP